VRSGPAFLQLRRAQLILILAVLVPTVLMTAVGIVLLAVGGSKAASLVAGVLVLTFCTTSITGYILGSIWVGRGASLARLQSDFLTSVSHELRTPLTSLYLLLESLRDGRLRPAEQSNVLALMSGEIQRLDKLVARLLDLTRMETGSHVFERKPVDVAELVNEAIAAFDAATLDRPTRVEVTVEPGLTVVGDRPTLSRALTNLLVNAWKYSGEDKRISVRARGDKRQVEITVSDNGIGIPPEEQRTIFEGFARGKGATERGTPGLGLGLAIVRVIVRAHQGRIDVASAPGKSTTFTIRLPHRRLDSRTPTSLEVERA
jgi:two-component system, OmpR family, phosphate regulon sensor histidine kinase PhoR